MPTYAELDKNLNNTLDTIEEKLGDLKPEEIIQKIASLREKLNQIKESDKNHFKQLESLSVEITVFQKRFDDFMLKSINVSRIHFEIGGIDPRPPRMKLETPDETKERARKAEALAKKTPEELERERVECAKVEEKRADSAAERNIESLVASFSDSAICDSYEKISHNAPTLLLAIFAREFLKAHTDNFERELTLTAPNDITIAFYLLRNSLREDSQLVRAAPESHKKIQRLGTVTMLAANSEVAKLAGTRARELEVILAANKDKSISDFWKMPVTEQEKIVIAEAENLSQMTAGK